MAKLVSHKDEGSYIDAAEVEITEELVQMLDTVDKLLKENQFKELI
jgi:hypothetical protein